MADEKLPSSCSSSVPFDPEEDYSEKDLRQWKDFSEWPESTKGLVDEEGLRGMQWTAPILADLCIRVLKGEKLDLRREIQLICDDRAAINVVSFARTVDGRPFLLWLLDAPPSLTLSRGGTVKTHQKALAKCFKALSYYDMRFHGCLSFSKRGQNAMSRICNLRLHKIFAFLYEMVPGQIHVDCTSEESFGKKRMQAEDGTQTFSMTDLPVDTFMEWSAIHSICFDLPVDKQTGTAVGRAKMLRKLLDVGASPTIQTPEGMSPLMMAAMSGNKSILDILLSSKLFQERPDLVDLQDIHGWTALCYALRHAKSPDVGIALIEKGASLTATGKDGKLVWEQIVNAPGTDDDEAKRVRMMSLVLRKAESLLRDQTMRALVQEELAEDLRREAQKIEQSIPDTSQLSVDERIELINEKLRDRMRRATEVPLIPFVINYAAEEIDRKTQLDANAMREASGNAIRAVDGTVYHLQQMAPYEGYKVLASTIHYPMPSQWVRLIVELIPANLNHLSVPDQSHIMLIFNSHGCSPAVKATCEGLGNHTLKVRILDLLNRSGALDGPVEGIRNRALGNLDTDDPAKNLLTAGSQVVRRMENAELYYSLEGFGSNLENEEEKILANIKPRELIAHIKHDPHCQWNVLIEPNVICESMTKKVFDPQQMKALQLRAEADPSVNFEEELGKLCLKDISTSVAKIRLSVDFIRKEMFEMMREHTQKEYTRILAELTAQEPERKEDLVQEAEPESESLPDCVPVVDRTVSPTPFCSPREDSPIVPE